MLKQATWKSGIVSNSSQHHVNFLFLSHLSLQGLHSLLQDPVDLGDALIFLQELLSLCYQQFAQWFTDFVEIEIQSNSG